MATQAVEPGAKPVKKGAARQPLHYRFILATYRIFAIAALYAVLLGVIVYAFVMGFYAVNSTWAAPVILSATDEKSLDFREKLITSQQAIEDLKVDAAKMTAGLEEMHGHRAALVALEPEIQSAIHHERLHDREDGPLLASLDQQKLADNAGTRQLLAQLKDMQANIEKDLAAGLITKADAASQLAALNQTSTAYTDSRIAQVLLTDTVLDKTTLGSTLDALQKEAELRSETAQLDVAIQVAEKELKEDNQQIARLHDAIVTAKQSPYYLSASGQPLLNFAFVPYDNQASATPGNAVYDCYLNMILCRKVGVVTQRFPGEEQILHPIFKTQIRGFLVQMNLSRAESAKSRTVFMGGKPLLF
ncbi:MAG: hypothetical protein ABSD59_16310 [Terracidiphilus sp.]